MLWGKRGSNSHALPHMILSHACLPIPALPLEQEIISERKKQVNKKPTRPWTFEVFMFREFLEQRIAIIDDYLPEIQRTQFIIGVFTYGNEGDSAEWDGTQGLEIKIISTSAKDREHKRVLAVLLLPALPCAQLSSLWTLEQTGVFECPCQW